MEIKDIDIKKLKPYKNNPRRNSEAIEKVANSIKAFGFKVPLVISEDNIIICGHTRLEAAKLLKLNKVPCVIASDLNDEQIQAFRLVDNKVSEFSLWDDELLNIELEELASSQLFNLADFGFNNIFEDYESEESEHVRTQVEDNEFNEEIEDLGTETEEIGTETGYYGDERELTYNKYKLYDFDIEACSGKYQLPTLEACHYMPKRLMGFNYLLSSDDYDAGIHFYLDDYQFERIWSNTEKYLDRLELFDCALTPNFSLYLDMPLAMKIWNVYRSRLIGQIMQNRGIKVIPTLQWADKETFEFCFDGLEPKGIYSVSTIGVKQDDDSFNAWVDGMNEAIKRLKPKALIIYGGNIDFDFGNIKVIYINNEVLERWKDD